MPEFLKGQWVTKDSQIAKILRVEKDEGWLDLVMYDRDGTRLGRVSEAGSGPKNYEPCCDQDGWIVVDEPKFPLKRCYYLHELLRAVDPNQQSEI